MRCTCGRPRRGKHVATCPTARRVRRILGPSRRELRAAQSAVDEAMRVLRRAQVRLRRALEAVERAA